MRVAQVARVRHESLGELVVVEETPHLPVSVRARHELLTPAPRSEMHLVDRNGTIEALALGPGRHPCLVRPLEREIADHGRRPRAKLHREADRIGLEAAPAVEARADGVLVERAGTDFRHERLPHAGLATRRHGISVLPVVEAPHHVHRRRVRRPDRETDAVDAGLPGRVGAEPFPDTQVVSASEPRQLVFRERPTSPSRHRVPPGRGASATGCG